MSRNSPRSDQRYKAVMDPNVYDTENIDDDGQQWPDEERDRD
ncbi:Uncharacterised protein [Mycobacteroides abscessus subsp. abscessus]|nr:hypothetical protein [Mycobacteroides abscessus]SKM37432.1 Uncharacterised protein [Mycobacteroides abscessus subsp. abscessus]